jgi:hypothetical protein
MRAWITLIIVGGLFAACGSSKAGSSSMPGKPTTVKEALAVVKSMVDATAAVAAAGYKVEPYTSFMPVACEGSAGHDDGTVSAPYGIKFALPDNADVPALFEKAKAYWERRHYHVGSVDLKSFDPRMQATRDGFELALHVVPSRHMAYLGGDTPCLPDK